MPSSAEFETCACGRNVAYVNCCGPHHETGYAGLNATAEDTMRSRYSAYVLKDEPYLLATWHESTKPASLSFDEIEWEGLTVLATNGGTGLSIDGTVEFMARFHRGDARLKLHERSSFVREGGRWFYVDGVDPNQ